MATVHLHVPEELHRRMLAELDDDLTWSGIFQRAVLVVLDGEGCPHRVLVARNGRYLCEACGLPIEIGPPST